MPIAAAGGPPPLGATPEQGGTTFAVWSTGEAVDLCLYDDAGRESRVRLTRSHQRRWYAHLSGRRKGRGSDRLPGVSAGSNSWHGHSDPTPPSCSSTPMLEPSTAPCASTPRCSTTPWRATTLPSMTRCSTLRTRRRSCRDRSSWTRGSTGPAIEHPRSLGRTPSCTSCTCAASPCVTRTCLRRCAAPTRDLATRPCSITSPLLVSRRWSCCRCTTTCPSRRC